MRAAAELLIEDASDETHEMNGQLRAQFLPFSFNKQFSDKFLANSKVFSTGKNKEYFMVNPTCAQRKNCEIYPHLLKLYKFPHFMGCSEIFPYFEAIEFCEFQEASACTKGNVTVEFIAAGSYRTAHKTTLPNGMEVSIGVGRFDHVLETVGFMTFLREAIILQHLEELERKTKTPLNVVKLVGFCPRPLWTVVSELKPFIFFGGLSPQMRGNI